MTYDFPLVSWLISPAMVLPQEIQGRQGGLARQRGGCGGERVAHGGRHDARWHRWLEIPESNGHGSGFFHCFCWENPGGKKMETSGKVTNSMKDL